MKKLPDSIEVVVTSDRSPREGALVSLKLGMIRKNSYSYILGPTNAEGIAQIIKSDLLGQANRTLELALMDYVPLESGYSGEIEAKVMTKSEIYRAIEAYKIYGPTEYPKGYIETLENELVEATSPKGLEVEIKQA